MSKPYKSTALRSKRIIQRNFISVEQWTANGDHSLDECYIIEGTSFLSEGKFVRYYRNPMISGDQTCPFCGDDMHVHGWIDSGGAGQIVCPESYVVRLCDGQVIVLNHRQLEALTRDRG